MEYFIIKRIESNANVAGGYHNQRVFEGGSELRGVPAFIYVQYAEKFHNKISLNERHRRQRRVVYGLSISNIHIWRIQLKVSYEK